MKLSEALLAGATILKTKGPTWEDDCWDAAALGLGTESAAVLYWSNPWGITPGDDLELWLRLVVLYRYRWGQVIKKLQSYGK